MREARGCRPPPLLRRPTDEHSPTTNGRGSDGAQAPPAGVAPPHSIEAEQSVLGAMLLSDTHALRVRHRGGAAGPRTSTASATGAIYEAMLALSRASEPIDVAHRHRAPALARQARRRPAAQAEIDALTARGPRGRQLRQLRADRPRERAAAPPARRRPTRSRPRVHDHEAPPRELVERAERADPRGRPRRPPEGLPPGRRGPRTTRSTSWQKLSPRARSLTGTPSGFGDLDAITGGFQPGNLIILAARPAMGKSALVTNIAENVALNQDDRARSPSSPRDVRGRARAALHRLAGVDQGRRPAQGPAARRGASGSASCARRSELDAAPLCVDDSSDIGILDVRAKARRLHQQARPRRRPRADHRRLPAADARRRAHREPRRAGRRDEPRAEDPRPRARACR